LPHQVAWCVKGSPCAAMLARYTGSLLRPAWQ
jgi:hypothetical protein